MELDIGAIARDTRPELRRVFGERFAFVLFDSGAQLHWPRDLIEQARESIRCVANQLRLVILRLRLHRSDAAAAAITVACSEMSG
jgi:hypothetical protein